MQSTAQFNRLRAALAASALARAGDKAFSRPGSGPGWTAAYLDTVSESDIARGLQVLQQQQAGVQSRPPSTPGRKALWFGKLVNGLPAWLRDVEKPRVPSPLERRAMRDMSIAGAIAAGGDITESIERGCAAFALRAEVDAAVASLANDKADAETRAAFEDHGRRQDLRKQIAEHEAFLAASRARNSAPPTRGPDLSVAFAKWRPGGRDRSEDSPKLWEVSLHESGHSIVAIALGLEIESVVAHRTGAGCCTITSESNRRATPEQHAAIFAAGTHAAFVAGAVETTRLQTGDPTLDGPQFTKNVGGNDEGDEAMAALGRARFLIEANMIAIHALAKILYDNGGTEVPGHSAHAIFEFYRGDHDERLDEMATEAALAGQDWPWARGRARGLG